MPTSRELMNSDGVRKSVWKPPLHDGEIGGEFGDDIYAARCVLAPMTAVPHLERGEPKAHADALAVLGTVVSAL
jgi:hypothetical protein